MEQRSNEWYEARRGKATASRIADIITRTKTGYGASRKNYLAQLVAERLTGTVANSFSNAAMQWGTDTEPQARAAYEFYKDCEVTETGFIDHPTIGMAGASPDGLVGDDGLVEIKCPNTATHIDTLLREVVPGKYITQMTWQMACTGRKWCDFVSFDPRMPANMSLFVSRVPLDESYLHDIEGEVEKFLDEVAKTEAELVERFAP